MTDWIEVPESTLAMAFDLVAQVDSACTVHVPRALMEGLIEFLGEDRSCDHSVNICNCAEAEAWHDMSLALDGKQTCGMCGGDGKCWTAAAEDKALSQIMSDRNLSKPMAIMWANSVGITNDLGEQVCDCCQGTGTVFFRDTATVVLRKS